MNPLPITVDWLYETTRLVTCGSNQDNACYPYGGTTTPRHTFSSVISNRQFTLHINPVSPDTDAGVYTCEPSGGGTSASVTLDACGKLPLYFIQVSLFQVMFRSV